VPLSVIGEQVVYGYDLLKINAALRELGYTLQREPPALAPVGGNQDHATPGAEPAAGCAPAEVFDTFYAAFQADADFQIQRTRFPLVKRTLSGSRPYLTTDEAAKIEKNQVVAGEVPVYLDRELIETGGYTQQISKKDGGLVEIMTSPQGAEPLTLHKFQKESGCWFLTELVSYEYFGSMMILK
jgi:hypothetical protein